MEKMKIALLISGIIMTLFGLLAKEESKLMTKEDKNEPHDAFQVALLAGAVFFCTGFMMTVDFIKTLL